MSSEIVDPPTASVDEPVAPATDPVTSAENTGAQQAPPSPTEPEKPSEAANGDAAGEPVDGPETADDAAAVDGGDAAAKKHKRRSSGVPEHKAKKLNKKKSMPNLQLDAKPGDYFFARLKGYAPWPSMVADEDILPEKMLSTRPVTAQNANGTYRADFEEGGKNVRDRTYPILFLGTYEFAWMPNTDLVPLTPSDLKAEGKPKKVSKGLSMAYDEAMEGHDLPHFKKVFAEHQRKIEEAIAEQERLEEEKEAKRLEKEAEKAAAKLAKSEKAEKRKSQAAPGDPMDIDGEGAPSSTKKSAKKRKNVDGAEDTENASKTPKKSKTLNLKSGTNGEASASKPKPKKVSKPSKEVSPVLTPEERYEKVKREVFYYRHKLQKGFLGHGTLQESDMKSLAEFYELLEAYQDLDPKIIKETKIYKVLKAVAKLENIPKEEEFHFINRSQSLLAKWGVESASREEPKSEDKAETNGATAPAAEKSDDEKPETTSADVKPSIITPDVKEENTNLDADGASKPAASEAAETADLPIISSKAEDLPEKPAEPAPTPAAPEVSASTA